MQLARVTPQQAFLRSARDQPPVAREHAAAGEAARARGARAVGGIQQPIVHAHAAVKPHGVIDAGDHQLAACQATAVRHHGGVEQIEIGHVGQQAAMQRLIVGQRGRPRGTRCA